VVVFFSVTICSGKQKNHTFNGRASLLTFEAAYAMIKLYNNMFKRSALFMENLILVVDDEKPIVEILKVNLIKSGYRVIEAYDGNEAVVKAISEDPDLILLDVMLPGLDGFSVCKKIRETSSVPIIMLTAREEEFPKEAHTSSAPGSGSILSTARSLCVSAPTRLASYSLSL